MSMLLTVLCTARSVVMPEPPLPEHENMPVAAGLTTEIFCPRMILKQQPGNLDIRNPGETIEPDEHADRIARLLLSLIEDAGLNQLDALSPIPSRSVRDSLNAMQLVTQNQEFIRGRQLSEIVRFQPGMSARGREKLMKELEHPDMHWPAGRTRIFFQIFMSAHVSRDEAEFRWPGGAVVFRPERGISINGESLEGRRPPYWVILSFRRGTDGDIICSEGYAHALFRMGCPGTSGQRT